jgi:hypothetical protein
MTYHGIGQIATLSLVIAAVAAPTASAGPHGTPLWRHAMGVATTATASQHSREAQDSASFDARDAATRTPTVADAAGDIDRRSPDARDVADGRGAWNSPPVTIVRVPQPASSSSGLDWGDAGIGAGAVVGLMLLALGSALAIVHRRHGGREPKRSATVA